MNIILDAAIIVRNTKGLANIIKVNWTEEGKLVGNWKLIWTELNNELPDKDRRNNSILSWDYCAKNLI
jgi:hypothetical protein